MGGKKCFLIEDGKIIYTMADINDYKFFCFNGCVKLFKIDMNRFGGHFANYYDRHGHLLPFGEAAFPPKIDTMPKMPYNLQEMIEIAECLSKGHAFLRVDLYNVNKNIYFSELTFYPASGLGRFTNDQYDKVLGSYLNLK